MAANRKWQIRTDAVERLDSVLHNATTGMGDPNYDKTAHHKVAVPKRLSPREKEDLFESSWICRKICSAYPSESTRRWMEVTLGAKSDPKTISEFAQYDARLNLREAFENAQTWANIYKGAAIVLLVDDGRSPDMPINRENIRSIDGVEVFDFEDIRPYISVTYNPLKPDHYELQTYAARQALYEKNKSKKSPGFRFHPDRVIRFDGFKMPPKAMLRNDLWGGSLLDSIYSTFTRYESTNSAVANMTQDYNVFIYALKGLGELIGSNDDNDLLKLHNRLRSLRLNMSNLKGLVIDAEGEKGEFVSRNFAGLKEILMHFRDELIGASGLPHNAVFGDASGGLGSTGQSESDTWAKHVGQFQENVFRPKLQPLLELIWLAQDGPGKGRIPEDWGFTFKPLQEETEATKIQNRSTQAQTDNTYVQMGSLLPEEVRVSRFGGSQYSHETTLDEEAWEKSKQEDQFDMGAFGDEGGFGEEAPEGGEPGEEAIAEEEPAQPELAAAGGVTRDSRRDSKDPIKRVQRISGMQIGITHDPGDFRFGRMMPVGYGHIRQSYGQAEDGRSIDVYVGNEPSSPHIFRFKQLDPKTMLVDETKYLLNFPTIEAARDAILEVLPRTMYGGIEAIAQTELHSYHVDCSADCGCGCSAKAKPEEDEEEKTPPKRKRKKKQSTPQPNQRELERVDPKLATVANLDRANLAQLDADDPEIEDFLIRKAANLGAPVMQGWVQQVRQWLEAAKSQGLTLEQARDRLPQIYPQLVTDKLATPFSQMMAIAELGGQLEIIQEQD